MLISGVVRPKTTLTVLSLLFLALCTPAVAQDRYGGIKLLEGYSFKEQWAVDANAWTIEKTGGPTIHFEAGPTEGSWADPAKKSQYSWYREQTVHGSEVRLAMTKRGVKTVWDDNFDAHSEPGGILLVTFLTQGEDSYRSADFMAKVKDERELADILVMVLTFDPSKGNF